jgi:hypothetical protein
MIVRTHNTICPAVDETSFDGRLLELEAAPTAGLMRLGFGVDVDAVYVVMYSVAAIARSWINMKYKDGVSEGRIIPEVLTTHQQ